MVNTRHYFTILLKVLFPLQAKLSNPAQLQKCIARVASERYLRYSLRNNEQVPSSKYDDYDCIKSPLL